MSMPMMNVEAARDALARSLVDNLALSCVAQMRVVRNTIWRSFAHPAVGRRGVRRAVGARGRRQALKTRGSRAMFPGYHCVSYGPRGTSS